MHTREFFYDNYKNHPEPVLKRIAGEYDKLTPHAQEALRDVLQEKNMTDLLAALHAKPEKKESLAHLSADEVRVMINLRLDRGEKLEVIKMDLQDKGVSIFNLSLQENKKEEEIDQRFIELQREGKSKAEIDAQLKKEFNLSDKTTRDIPERMRSNGTGLIVTGGLLLMVGVPWLAVLLQTPGRHNAQYPVIMVGSGIAFLILGIRKRMIAAKFIREAEEQKAN